MSVGWELKKPYLPSDGNQELLYSLKGLTFRERPFVSPDCYTSHGTSTPVQVCASHSTTTHIWKLEAMGKWQSISDISGKGPSRWQPIADGLNVAIVLNSLQSPEVIRF